MASSVALKQKYIEHMHEKLLELYLAYQHKDPLRLFYEEKDLEKILKKRANALEWKLSPEDLIITMFHLYRYMKAAETLKDIVNEANNFLLRKRIYEFFEDWSIRGIIDWPQTIRNLIYNRPIAQKVIGYTLNSPENLLLRATVDYTLNELKKLRENINNEFIIRVLGVKTKASKFPAFRETIRKIKKVTEELRNAVENSFLARIPSNTYDPEFIESLWELVDEVEYMPWKPEWVQKLIDDVIYRYFLFEPDIEMVLKRISALVMDHLINQSNLTNIRQALGIYSYKLYEVYCLYLLIKIFDELGMSLEFNYRSINARKSSQRIVILFNREIKNTEHPIKAIPDISLVNTRRIVFEAKFSSNSSYLSNAVFKVISYMVLLNAEKGILAYPMIPERTPMETEDEEIYTSIIKRPGKEVVIKINDREYKLYPLEITPIENKEEKNKAVLKAVIMDVLV